MKRFRSEIVRLMGPKKVNQQILHATFINDSDLVNQPIIEEKNRSGQL
jgi:hypothetical protein